MCGVSEISPTALKRVAAGLSQCERSCQSKLGTGGANRRCDCDGYRPDIFEVRHGLASIRESTYAEP